MNMDKLKDALRPWIKIETWYTSHPLDEQRFHKALQRAFSILGTALDGSHFKEAISELADEYHPDLNPDYKENIVDKFSLRAEYIASYLHDTK